MAKRTLTEITLDDLSNYFENLQEENEDVEVRLATAIFRDLADGNLSADGKNHYRFDDTVCTVELADDDEDEDEE